MMGCAMSVRCVARATWLGAGSMMALCLVFGDTSSAQSTLPPVTVDAPKPQAARPTQPSRRAVRSQGGTRRVAAPARQQNVEPGARGAGGAAGERANGPVVGYLASESATATKTDTPILTTPQSISVVTKDQMQDQGAQNVTEALRYTPGVTVQSFGANAFFDSFKLRGFDAPQISGRLAVAGGRHNVRDPAH